MANGEEMAFGDQGHDVTGHLAEGSSTGVPKAKRGHVQDLVLAKLRHGLMAGAFLPGQVMSLRKLAAALDTSPMPVREALGQLVAARALEEMPNRSVCVPRLTESRITELFEVRSAIEGMAARSACAKATPELRARLRVINDALLSAIRRRDLLQCLAQNQAFHFTLYQAAESDVLMPLIESLWLRAGPTMYLSLLSPDMPWQAEAHVDLLAALDAGDAAAAGRAIERDVRASAKNLLKSGVLRNSGGVFNLPTLDFVPLVGEFGAKG